MPKLLQIIQTNDAPKSSGPYSQAISVDISSSKLLFLSGQLPLDPMTGKLINETIEEATRQIFDNIDAILHASHSDFDHVIRVEVFMKDLNDFPKVNEEFIRRFNNATFPTRQTTQVARLPLDARIEISCIALCP